MRSNVTVFLSVFLAFLITTPAWAQTGTLQGRVLHENEEPLPGANVVLRDTEYGTATRSDGRYRITGIEPGQYTAAVTFVGFRPATVEVTIRAGSQTVQNFTLEEAPLQARGVTVTVGSRATHQAAGDLAVPVDVFSAEELGVTGTTETALILQQVSPSVNFPRQTVADGMDALRPFTLRGLSPDHTLVLINGKRRHKSALVNRLGSGVQKGSSTVDLNAIPSSVIGGIEVLRDGAAAQYGSDAIAGVINIQLKEEPLPLTVSGQLGGHVTDDYSNDGTNYNVAASYGIPLGSEGGYFNVFSELRFRDPTNRAGASPRDQIEEGDADVVQDIDGDGVNEVLEKNNPAEQPNFHWGNGASDNYYVWGNGAYPVANFGAEQPTEIYGFGGYSFRNGLGQGFYRRALGDRNWPQIHPQGFLPNFDININDYSASLGLRGMLGQWNYDLNGQFGANDFEYNITNSLNVTLGPNSNQTEFFAGTVALQQSHGQLDLSRAFDVGWAGPLNVAAGAILRYDRYEVTAGEEASWIDGPVKETQNGNRAAPGAQVFPGFRPDQEVDESRTNIGAYVDLESDVTEQLLVNVAGRFENYSDFGSTVNGKLAMRLQPQEEVIFRGAISTGFRAPNLAQRYFSKISTTFIDNVPNEVGLFRNNSDVANALGVQELEEETSINVSSGVTLSPNSNLSISADVFYIDIRDRIILSGNLGGEEIVDLLEANGVVGVQRVQVFSNAIDTQTWGLDLSADYRTALGDDALLTLSGAFNFTRNRLVGGPRTPSQLSSEFQRSIFGREARLELEKERPKNTLKLSAQYEKGNFTGTVRATRYGETLVPDDTPDEDFTLSSETTLDLEVGYDIVPDNVKLSVGARNLLDNYPDLTPPGENFLGIFPYSTASPIGFNGRYVYTKLRFTL